jgi:stearoyl-CoA desaturase (delta-9 desaturase)
MTATSITTLPHVLFRRSPSFYLKYDLSWLIALSSSILVMEVLKTPTIAPTWHWYFVLVLPVVLYAHILCNVFIHNACHSNFPKTINRVLGEIFGIVVLTRFASWEIIHARHHKYPDDTDRDPHALDQSYWRFIFRLFAGIERQLQRTYYETHGDTPENHRREHIRTMISYATTAMVLAVWWRLLGNVGFFFFYIPATIIGWLHVMHFNWVTHNALARNGDFKPVNLDSGIYWLGNRLLFGIYMHANHHRKASVFNPLKMDARPQDWGTVA